MFNFYNINKKAILVYIYNLNYKYKEDLKEFKSLVISSGIDIIHVVIINNKIPKIKYFIGKGKVEEIANLVKINNPLLIIFNKSLSPSQENNLSKKIGCPIIDRTKLILNIFSQRAFTNESKLQINLAKLKYISTRLIHGWTHLERQKGGIGLNGPGEKQLETDRRLLKNKIKQILKKLNKIKQQQKQSRFVNNNIPIISLVGYTNAGKSTLFNILTKEKTYVSNNLFTTLDPIIRKFNIKDIGNSLLIDTIGFIQHLPHELIKSFETTLQSTQKSTLLLHIVDSNNKRVDENVYIVNKILAKIKADKIPMLLIMNKIDLLQNCFSRIERNSENVPIKVWISSYNSYSISLLKQALKECLLKKKLIYKICILQEHGKIRSIFYKINSVKKEWVDQCGHINLLINITLEDWNRILKKEIISTNYIIYKNIK